MSEVNALITTSGKKYKNFTVLKSVKRLAVMQLDTLVFHDSTDEPQEVLSMLRDKEITNLYYICDETKMLDEIKVFISGKGGQLITDEFYLENNDTLSSLTSNSEVSKELVSTKSVNVLEDFLKKAQEGNTSFAKPYLDLVKKATTSVIEDSNRRSEELSQASQTAVMLFESASRDLDDSVKAQENLSKKLESLETLLEETNNAKMNSPSVTTFAASRYSKHKPAIVLKELGNVPYITSFALGLMEYMNKKRNMNSRIIIVLPPGTMYEDMYTFDDNEDYEFITNSNHRSRKAYKSRVTFVNYPISTVFTKLFTDAYDSYIVLDRTKTSEFPILLKQNAKENYMNTWYGVQNTRMFKTYPKLSKSRTFTGGIAMKGTMFAIPTFTNYSTNPISRVSTYIKECKEAYDKLIGDLI